MEMAMDPKDIIRILKKRYATIVAVLGMFVIAAIVINEITPPTYQSQTTIRIKQPKVLEDYLGGNTPGGAGNRQIMETYGEILKSRTVIDEVIAEIQAQTGQRPLFSSIKTVPVRDTELLRIDVEASSPEEAQLVANILLEKSAERISYFTHAEQTNVRKFIGERLQEAKKDLERNEAALEAYKRREKILSPEVQTTAMAERLVSIDKLKADNIVAIASAQARLASAQENLSEDRVKVIADNALIQQYRANLAAHDTELLGLLERYTEKHPQVIATKARITETRAKLNEEITHVVNEESATANPLHIALLQNKMQAEAEIDVVTAQNQAIDRVLAEGENELTQLPAKEQGLGRIMRDVSVAQEIYTLLAKRHEEARISEVMQPADVEVIDNATISRVPVKPNKAKNILLAAILGLVTGTALVFFLESLNKTIRTPEDVQRYLDMPVLSSIPGFDMKNERIRKLFGYLNRPLNH